MFSRIDYFDKFLWTLILREKCIHEYLSEDVILAYSIVSISHHCFHTGQSLQNHRWLFW